MEAEDIDYENKILYIRNQKGKRVDAIPLVHELEDHFKQMELIKTGRIFTQWSSRHSCKKFWEKLMQDLKFDYGFHQLRKARGTDMANAGVEPLFLQKYIRHRDLRTTQSYYIRLDNQKIRLDIEKKLAKI